MILRQFGHCTVKQLSFPFLWIRICHLLCYKPDYYPITSKKGDRIFILSPILASVIYQISWISWIYWIPDPFNENSNILIISLPFDVFVNNTNLTFLFQSDLNSQHWPSLVYKSDADPTVLSRHVLTVSEEASMLILYKNDRNVRFVLFTKTSKPSLQSSEYQDKALW